MPLVINVLLYITMRCFSEVWQIQDDLLLFFFFFAGDLDRVGVDKRRTCRSRHKGNSLVIYLNIYFDVGVYHLCFLPRPCMPTELKGEQSQTTFTLSTSPPQTYVFLLTAYTGLDYVQDKVCYVFCELHQLVSFAVSGAVQIIPLLIQRESVLQHVCGNMIITLISFYRFISEIKLLGN